MMAQLVGLVPKPGRAPGARLPRLGKPDADKPTSGGKMDFDSGEGQISSTYPTNVPENPRP